MIENKRAGVIWRLAGACLRLQKHEKKLVKMITSALSSSSAAEADDNQQQGGEQEDVVRALLGSTTLQANEEDGRLYINVPGARILDCLMRMPGDLGVKFCKAILVLPPSSLCNVAKDNVGSRTLLDPILASAEDGPGRGKGLAEMLASKISGKCADLAAHPVGFHVLTKCFSCIGCNEKRSMAQELLVAESRLAGAHFGRRALAVLSVPLLRQNPSKWEQVMAKGEKKRQVVEEIFDILDEKKTTTTAGSAAPAAVEKKKGKEKKKDKPHKGEKGSSSSSSSDPLMALLMGEGNGTANGKEMEKKSKKKEKTTRTEKEGSAAAADLGFVLDAIKASGGSGKAEKREQDGEEAEEEEEDRPRHTSTKEQKKQRKNKALSFTSGETDKRQHKKGSRGGGRRQSEAAEEHPIEKAKRILGKRTMMSKGELFTAVGDLEQEYNKKKKKQQ